MQFRVTDSEGKTGTLAKPLEVTISGGTLFNPVNVTPPMLNFYPEYYWVNGTYLYNVYGDPPDPYILKITSRL